jgi:hypothetical protein
MVIFAAGADYFEGIGAVSVHADVAVGDYLRTYLLDFLVFIAYNK